MTPRKVLKLGRWRVKYYGGRNRSQGDYMGRFGGGWQWKLGITAGDWHPVRGRTFLIALLVDEYRIQVCPRD